MQKPWNKMWLPDITLFSCYRHVLELDGIIIPLVHGLLVSVPSWSDTEIKLLVGQLSVRCLRVASSKLSFCQEAPVTGC